VLFCSVFVGIIYVCRSWPGAFWFVAFLMACLCLGSLVASFVLVLDTARIVYGPYNMAGGTLGPTLASGSLG